MSKLVKHQYKAGDRVRIESSEEPYVYIGKLATVKRSSIRLGTEQVTVEVEHTRETVVFPAGSLERLTTIPRSLLANDLFLPWDPSTNRSRMSAFLDSPWIAGRTLEAMLLYDQVIIPTVDFAVIIPLIHWLTPGVFKEALVSGALSFVRYRGGLAYIGNGNGLGIFQFRSNPTGECEDNLGLRAANYSPHDAALIHLEHRINGLPKKTLEPLARLIEICTVETALPDFQTKVAHESYLDIMGSDLINTGFEEGMNLTRLPGVADNQLRHYKWHQQVDPNDPINLTLRVGMLNLQTYLAEEAGAHDMASPDEIVALMRSKYHRYTGGDAATEAFSSIRAIENIPDVAASVTEREVTPGEIWRLRNTGRAKRFRVWFDEIGPDDPEHLVSEYVSTLTEASPLTNRGGKILKFALINAAGLALMPIGGPISIGASLALSLADSFLLDRIRLGFRPRFFINDVRSSLGSRGR